jgi:transposase InsO family protein
VGHWKENASSARHSLYPDLVSWHHETALGGPTGTRRLVGRASRKRTACGLEFHPPDFSSPAWAKVKAGRAGLLAALCDCEAWIKGKHARLSFHPVTERATQRLDLVYADICGPFPLSLTGKGRYMFLFIDDATGYTWCYILEHKSDTEGTFHNGEAEMQTQYSLQAKCFRTDGGGEFTSKRFSQYLRDHVIRKETTRPYSPQSNGVAERANRMILERVRPMLADADLSKRYWAEASMTAVYVTNVSPTRALDRKLGGTPYEAWHGKQPDVNHLRVFGSLAFFHVCRRNARSWTTSRRPTSSLDTALRLKLSAYTILSPRRWFIDCARYMRLVGVPSETAFIFRSGGLKRLEHHLYCQIDDVRHTSHLDIYSLQPRLHTLEAFKKLVVD